MLIISKLGRCYLKYLRFIFIFLIWSYYFSKVLNWQCEQEAGTWWEILEFKYNSFAISIALIYLMKVLFIW